MRNLLPNILLFCLLIAACQALVTVLTIAIVLALIVGLIWRPAETMSLLLVLFLLEALGRWPLATVGSLIGLAGAFLIASRAKRDGERSRRPVGLLPPPTERGGVDQTKRP